jgi:predicted HAD superfamily Cof-like phosphohydrolase
MQLERILSRLQRTVKENSNSLSVEGQIVQAIGVLLQAIQLRNQPTDFFGDIAQFHHKFGLAYQGAPRFLDEDTQEHRILTLDEELREYAEAIVAKDLEKQFDALIDLVYFALGTAHLHGFPFREGWVRVHDANMRKVRAKPDGSDSKRGADGKGFACDVIKPPGWVVPRLYDLMGLPEPKPKIKLPEVTDEEPNNS